MLQNIIDLDFKMTMTLKKVSLTLIFFIINRDQISMIVNIIEKDKTSETK